MDRHLWQFKQILLTPAITLGLIAMSAEGQSNLGGAASPVKLGTGKYFQFCRTFDNLRP
jgi:hypothetical protein